MSIDGFPKQSMAFKTFNFAPLFYELGAHMPSGSIAHAMPTSFLNCSIT